MIKNKKVKVKNFLCILLSSCIALSFAACADKNPNVGSSVENGTVSNNQNENGAVYTLLGYTTAQNSVSVGGGYYDIASNNDGSANMMYTDFATAHRSYLSNDADSQHNTADDTSYIEYTLRGVSVLATPNYLYAVKDGTPSLAEEYGEEGQCYFEQMSYTGENHRRLYLAPTAYFSRNGQFAFDGENIIMVVINYTKGTDLMRDSEYEQYLAALNEETGKETRLYTFDTDFTYGIVGVGGDCLFLQGFRQVRNVVSTETDQEYKLISLNLKTGEEKELFFCDDYRKNVKWINYEQQMCYLDFEKNQFTALSADGTETVLCENVIPNISKYAGWKIFRLSLFDDRILIDLNNDNSGESVELAFNTADKTVSEVKILENEEFAGATVAGDEYYVVLYGRENSSEASYPDCYKRMLIKKDDYWAGNLQLIEITDDYTKE